MNEGNEGLRIERGAEKANAIGGQPINPKCFIEVVCVLELMDQTYSSYLVLVLVLE